MNSRCTGGATDVAARHDDQRAVVQEGSVERGEHVVAKFGVTAEVALDRLALCGARCPPGWRQRRRPAAIRESSGAYTPSTNTSRVVGFGEMEAARVDDLARGAARAPAETTAG